MCRAQNNYLKLVSHLSEMVTPLQIVSGSNEPYICLTKLDYSVIYWNMASDN